MGVEKRGVGAMEIVAMDMKLRGMYIARQLSFSGVQFRIEEVELSERMEKVYNKSVDLWGEMLHKFTEAADLIDAEKKMKKTMWGQFWSSHQRFFKYLCIASKVHFVCRVAQDVIKMGKCVVIGLQSTGEARTMEAIEREEELTDFVSTAKGVIQSLVEKHFPAPDRDKINRILGIGPKKSILDELGLKLPKNGSSNDVTNGNTNNGKRKRKAAENMSKKMKTEWDTLGSSDDEDEEKDKNSDYEANHSEPEEEDSDEDVNSSDFEEEDEEDDFNPFGSGSEDDDDPWAKRAKKKAKKASKKPKKKKAKKKKSTLR